MASQRYHGNPRMRGGPHGGLHAGSHAGSHAAINAQGSHAGSHPGINAQGSHPGINVQGSHMGSHSGINAQGSLTQGGHYGPIGQVQGRQTQGNQLHGNYGSTGQIQGDPKQGNYGPIGQVPVNYGPVGQTQDGRGLSQRGSNQYLSDGPYASHQSLRDAPYLRQTSYDSVHDMSQGPYDAQYTGHEQPSLLGGGNYQDQGNYSQQPQQPQPQEGYHQQPQPQEGYREQPQPQEGYHQQPQPQDSYAEHRTGTSGQGQERNQQQPDVTLHMASRHASHQQPVEEGHYSVSRSRESHYNTQRSSEGPYSTLRSTEDHSTTASRSSLHSKQPSDASSRERKSNASGYSKSPQHHEPPTVMEAAQVVEILRRRIAFLSGGRDRRGGPVLTLPTHHLNTELPPQDIIACLSYLASVPSEESASKGFTVVVDNREGFWRNLRTLFRAIEQSLGGRLYGVYVLRPDQILDRQRLNLSFRKDKTPLSFDPQFLTLQRLLSFVDGGQLTSDLGGTMPYNHETWLNNRLALERFVREARSVGRHLDAAMAQLTARLRREETTSPQDLLRQHRLLQENVLQSPEHVISTGRRLYDGLAADQDAGFRPPAGALTLDTVVAMNQVKRAVETLENRLDKLQDFWQERDRELSQTVQYSNLDAAMKTVVDWIVGPAEKLLRSQADIGENYKTADELRKQHEQLELKCTDTYGTYAELRHRVDELLKDGHEKADDVTAQRDYMDTVCRSYAARLERRRNLVITSVRFHRLAEELSRRLDDLLELLCTDIVAGDVDTVETALRVLQEKVDTITLSAEQTVSEGQSLLDQLSLPVKNAFGKDVTPDNAARTAHVQTLLDELQERKLRADELAGVRKLKLQQILQLRTCERDADQAIQWIVELCDVMMVSQMELGRSPTEAEQMQVEHQKFETTAKGTYEYGKQLLQAALVLRRSLRYDLDPNTRQGQQLAAAWKKFSQGINERAIRLNNVFIFNKNADALLENVEEMILVISRCVNLEITVEDLVVGYESSRDHMKRQYNEVVKLGEDLLRRLSMPVLTLDGDEKHFTLDDEGTSEVIKGKMALLKTKMTNLKRYWDEQTQGLHLGLHGELLGPDGLVIRPAPSGGDSADNMDNMSNKVKHRKHTIGGEGGGDVEYEDENYESREKRMAEMAEAVKETLASRKSLWDDLMEQTPTRPSKNDVNQRVLDTDIIPLSIVGQSLHRSLEIQNLQRTSDGQISAQRSPGSQYSQRSSDGQNSVRSPGSQMSDGQTSLRSVEAQRSLLEAQILQTSPEGQSVADSQDSAYLLQQIAPLNTQWARMTFNEGAWEEQWADVESKLRDGAVSDTVHDWRFVAGSLPALYRPNACWAQEVEGSVRTRALSF